MLLHEYVLLVLVRLVPATAWSTTPDEWQPEIGFGISSCFAVWQANGKLDAGERECQRERVRTRIRLPRLPAINECCLWIKWSVGRALEIRASLEEKAMWWRRQRKEVMQMSNTRIACREGVSGTNANVSLRSRSRRQPGVRQ